MACTARSSRMPTNMSNRSSTIPCSSNISGIVSRSESAGSASKAKLLPFVGTIFPNTSYHGRQPRGLCAWHPHSPTSTEGWRFFLVDKDAPGEVKDYLRRYYMRYSGPAGMTEQDDMENWLYATAASTGTVARRYPFNYQQSMGAFATDHPLGGEVSTQITEQIARNYYRVYARYLQGRLGIIARARRDRAPGGRMNRPRSQAWYTLKQDVEDFLYMEADLLDQRMFREWLDLLAEDLIYFMPIRRNVKFGQHAEKENTRQGEGISWFDEDKWTLGKRVEQILTGVHYAEEPLSRVTHMVSNVRLLEVAPSAEDPTDVVVGCRFLVYQNRIEYRPTPSSAAASIHCGGMVSPG